MFLPPTKRSRPRCDQLCRHHARKYGIDFARSRYFDQHHFDARFFKGNQNLRHASVYFRKR
jgi:hypothetical protein